MNCNGLYNRNVNMIQNISLQYVQSLTSNKLSEEEVSAAMDALTSLSKRDLESLTEEEKVLVAYLRCHNTPGVDLSLDKTIEILENAMDKGNQDARVILSVIRFGYLPTFEDDGTAGAFMNPNAKYINLTKAHLLLENAALSGHLYGMYYYAGIMMQSSYEIAFNYLDKCKNANYIGGAYLEGLWLFDDGPLDKDPAKAVVIWEQAYNDAQVEDMFALEIYVDLCYALSYAYAEGKGCAIDEEKAQQFLKRAALGAHADAITLLAEETGKSQSDSPMSVFQNKDHTAMIFQTDALLPALTNKNTLNNGVKIIDEGTGYYTASFPEDEEHKPSIRVRIHYPKKERNPEYSNFLSMKQTEREALLDELLEPLNRLPGLDNIKAEVKDIVSYSIVNLKRKEAGLKTKSLGNHMLFLGNPGTGKTIIARLLGEIFYQIGLLEQGHVVESDATVLTGEFVGWSASKTQLACTTALDGVLFIDEAYAISEDVAGIYGGSFGIESINTLMKFMEDFSSQMIVIACGYKDKMEGFIRANPGLRSRFSQHIEFKDYQPQDMFEIFKIFAADNDYILEEGADKKLLIYLKSIKGNVLDRFANARGVRNLFDGTVKRQANRLMKKDDVDKEAMMLLIADDIPVDKTIEDGNISYMKNKK